MAERKNSNEEKIKEAVASQLYQKFGEHFFDHELSEYFLDCLAYLSGSDSAKTKAVNRVGEQFIVDCLLESQ